MTIIEDIRHSDARFPHVVLTVGSFDGVHLGHRRILELVVQAAKASGGTAAVMTLRPHPRQVFSPGHAPNLLTSDGKKLQLLEEAGIDVAFFLQFDADAANMDRADFVEYVMCRQCHAKEVVVGHDFRFGKDALGDYEFLSTVSQDLGFTVSQAPPLVIEGECVSSTLVREQILQGDVERAETFLGRKYSILAAVVPGRGVGAGIGFPTANIEPRHIAVPAQGVYVAEAVVEGDRRPAAVNIGIAPTVRQEDIMVEAHILDFSANIVGRNLEVVFHKRLRPERKFPTREALAAQIRRDVAKVKGYFSSL